SLMTTVSAPAKVILFGEHAVVYGEPALAVPVSQLRTTATLSAADQLTITATDMDETLVFTQADAAHPLVQMTTLTLRFLDALPPEVNITLRSTIPLGSGLGSGAAVSTALGRALALALGQTIPDVDLNALVYEVERIHHGTPSGIDNTVIVYERPVWFIRDSVLETLTIAQPFTLLIADTGQSALTHHAVTDVRTLVTSQPDAWQPVLAEIGEITRQARIAIESGANERLGDLANRNHALLQQLTVSSPALDHLVAAARQAGAAGAKLSGGGRGGNLIAFVTPDTADAVQKVLVAAGAVRVFQTVIQ
ncbi:MAG: mevalonate kinase, partial [Armatimonadetes bacterium]|nr:mevalonate kinase [Anaerolineae bacterium]